jgi:hypothetical protein
MACCALKKQKKQLIILPVFLFFMSSIIGGSIILILFFGGLFSQTLAEKKHRSAIFLNELLIGLKNRILDQPFLFDSSVRCKVSGRLMRRYPQLAGTVYRYFNLIVLAVLLISFFSLFQGARALII